MNEWGLDFWKSKDWSICQQRLDKMERDGVRISPDRNSLFRSLSSVGGSSSSPEVRCVLIGQDPYPDRRFATGLAFSIPSQFGRTNYPPTLREIFREYHTDLRYDIPSSGDLSRWCVHEGVLLWNAVPVTRDGTSLGCDWKEWDSLNQEVLSSLSRRGIVFVFIGAVARRYVGFVGGASKVIVTSHPSPLGNINSKTPFKGSRIFTTVNQYLNELGLDPVDWRLDGAPSKKTVQVSGMAGGSLLPNITGYDLGGHPRSPKPNLYTPST